MKLRFSMALLIIVLMSALVVPTVGAQAPAECVNVITVWDGDTLYSIARRENYVVSELAAVNNIPVTTQLRIGDRLCVDGLAIAQDPPLTGGGNPNTGGDNTGGDNTGGDNTGGATNSPYNFTRNQGPLPAGWGAVNVLVGQTLYGISQALGNVTVRQLAESNNIENVDEIFAGESLLVPPSNTNNGGDNNNNGGDNNSGGDNTGGNTNTPVHRPAPGSIPTISIPGTAKAGDSIGVSGANYPGNTQVDIYFEKVSLGLSTAVVATVTTNPDGTFSDLVTVPDTFSNGAPINSLPTVSVSGYTRTGGYWAMNFFVVQ